MLNKIILIGNVGKDPVFSHLATGGSVCKFTLATSDKYKDKSGVLREKTEWHNIVTFGKLAETCNQYITKGKKIYVEGKISYSSFEGKDGSKVNYTSINAVSVQFLDGRTTSEQTEASGQSAFDNALKLANQITNDDRLNDTLSRVTQQEIVFDRNFTEGDIPF